MKKLLLTFVVLFAIRLSKESIVEAAGESMQTVTIESFRTQAQSTASDGSVEKVSFSKSTLEIYYYDLNGEKQVLETILTDDKGYVKNLSLDIPDPVRRNQLYFRYILKNDNYGSLVNKGGVQYRAITSAFIPENKVLNIDTTREFPEGSKFSRAVKTWELFVASADEIQNSVEYATEQTPFQLRDDFEFKPIFIRYEEGEDLSNSFNIAKSDIGIIQKGSPYISINDADVNTRLINLIHEWSHWVMYSALNGFNTGNGKYSGYYTVCEPRVSWKEGWALAQSNLVSTAYWGWHTVVINLGEQNLTSALKRIMLLANLHCLQLMVC